MSLKIFGQEISDKNSQYIGDGCYAHKEKDNRLWVFTTNGLEIQNKICLENDVFVALCRFYERNIQGD